MWENHGKSGRRIIWEEYGKISGNVLDGKVRKHANGKINRTNIAGGFSSNFCLKMFVL